MPVGSASFGTDTTGIDPVDGSGRPWQAYVFGCQVAEVEVDTVTGEVQVLGIWAVHDVGRAVNPQGVEGQIEGGVVQALGQGLMEDYKLERGHTSTSGFAKYILPTSLDVRLITPKGVVAHVDTDGLTAPGSGDTSHRLRRRLVRCPRRHSCLLHTSTVHSMDRSCTPASSEPARRDPCRADAACCQGARSSRLRQRASPSAGCSGIHQIHRESAGPRE